MSLIRCSGGNALQSRRCSRGRSPHAGTARMAIMTSAASSSADGTGGGGGHARGKSHEKRRSTAYSPYLGQQKAAASSHCGEMVKAMPEDPCQQSGSPTTRPLGAAQLLFASLLCMYLSCGAWSPLLFASMFSAFRELAPSRCFFFLFFLSPFFFSLGHPLRRPRSTTPPPRHPPVLPPPAALMAVVAITFQVTQRLPPRPHLPYGRLPPRPRLPRLPRPHWQALPVLPVHLPVHQWQATLPLLGFLWCPTPT